MPLIRWDKSLDTGITAVDRQHRDLIERVNRLEQELPRGPLPPSVIPALVHLLESTRKHFADEEALMQEIDYPGREHHRSRHEQLASDLAVMLMRVRYGKPVNMFELLSFLREWLTDHIIKDDAAVGRWKRGRDAEASNPQTTSITTTSETPSV